MREWHGVTHTALIHADGIEWRGRLPLPFRDRAKDHRRPLVGPTVLRPQAAAPNADSRSRAEEGRWPKADLARTGSTIRCAIYTRKSSDEGIEQEFNSLDAQREGLRGLYREPASCRLDRA